MQGAQWIIVIVSTTGLFGKHFKSRLDKLANIGDSFDFCRIYRHLVVNGQLYLCKCTVPTTWQVGISISDMFVRYASRRNAALDLCLLSVCRFLGGWGEGYL